MTALSSAALPTLSASTPTYDRAAATVGIVHFGFGNFHRSHVAMYLDALMERGEGLDWGICGVGVLEQDATMRDVMRAQDCLFTLVVRHPDGSLEPRVVGSVLEYLYGPENAAAVHRRLDDPAVRIVSLTVTEGGYLKNPATRRTPAPRSPTSSRGCGAAATRAPTRSPCCPATTSRATATTPDRPWWASPGSPTPSSRRGSTRR